MELSNLRSLQSVRVRTPQGFGPGHHPFWFREVKRMVPESAYRAYVTAARRT